MKRIFAVATFFTTLITNFAVNSQVVLADMIDPNFNYRDYEQEQQLISDANLTIGLIILIAIVVSGYFLVRIRKKQ